VLSKLQVPQIFPVVAGCPFSPGKNVAKYPGCLILHRLSCCSLLATPTVPCIFRNAQNAFTASVASAALIHQMLFLPSALTLPVQTDPPQFSLKYHFCPRDYHSSFIMISCSLCPLRIAWSTLCLAVSLWHWENRNNTILITVSLGPCTMAG
jgi:hypothetical protein